MNIGRKDSAGVNSCITQPTSRGTYANTYDSVAIPVLKTIVPTQSISWASCFNIVLAGLGRRSHVETCFREEPLHADGTLRVRKKQFLTEADVVHKPGIIRGYFF